MASRRAKLKMLMEVRVLRRQALDDIARCDAELLGSGNYERARYWRASARVRWFTADAMKREADEMEVRLSDARREREKDLAVYIHPLLECTDDEEDSLPRKLAWKMMRYDAEIGEDGIRWDQRLAEEPILEKIEGMGLEAILAKFEKGMPMPPTIITSEEPRISFWRRLRSLL